MIMKDTIQLSEIFKIIPIDLEHCATLDDKYRNELESASEQINYFIEKLLHNIPDWAISFGNDLSEQSSYFAPGTFVLSMSYNNKIMRLGTIKCSKPIDTDIYKLSQITCYLTDISKPDGMIQEGAEIANANKVSVIFKPYGTAIMNKTLIDTFVKAVRLFMQNGQYLAPQMLTMEDL